MSKAIYLALCTGDLWKGINGEGDTEERHFKNKTKRASGWPSQLSI